MEELKSVFSKWAKEGQLPLTSLFMSWLVKEASTANSQKSLVEKIHTHYNDLILNMELNLSLGEVFKKDADFRRAMVTNGVLMGWTKDSEQLGGYRKAKINSSGIILYYWVEEDINKEEFVRNGDWKLLIRNGLGSGKWDYYGGCGMIIPREVGIELDENVGTSITQTKGDSTFVVLPFKLFEREGPNFKFTGDSDHVILTCSCC